MKFDFCIGNPPYQANKNDGDGNKEYAAPIYHFFIDASRDIADKVEFIHPARFLFNAGSTSKTWNEQMLHDTHFKILEYESDAGKVFQNTDIKGGVAISYYDHSAEFGEIGVFTEHKEMRDILSRVHKPSIKSMSQIAISRTAYRLTEKLHEDYPEAISQLSNGHAYDMSTNIFDRLPQVFFDKKPSDGNIYAKIIGREKNERVMKFIRRDYINNVKNYDKYKVVIAKANGIGAFGEVLSSLFVEGPGVATTETFLSIGFFETKDEANHCLSYIKTKFFRALLGVLKKTQDVTPEKFTYIPLQSFDEQSEIEWSQPISNIDRQLYKKYGLSKEEIDFIETHVKEMK